jgi:putative FmdB family regulatory protein
MPTYVYSCEYGHEFEVYQWINESPVDRCPHIYEDGTVCQAKLRRVIGTGVPTVIFKGTGWTKSTSNGGDSA